MHLEKGKLPPQAIEIEKVIIGALMISGEAVETTIDIFRDMPVFYQEAHQKIYDSILELYRNSESIDLLTVSRNLKSKGWLEAIGGDYYLVQLSQMVSSTAHIEYHCRIIQQAYIKRKSIQAGARIIEQGYDESADVFDTLGDIYSEINDLADGISKKQALDFKSMVQGYFDSFGKKEAGLPSSLSKLNKAMNGYRGPDMIILAARPGMGKTALMLNEVLSLAKKGIPVAIFSLEMSERQLISRLLANYCGISSNCLRDNKLDDHELKILSESKGKFEKLPIHINDQAGISPLEIKIQISRWSREHGIQMCFVDYLQLITADGKQKGNREGEISSISRSLKGIAKEFNIPMMALSQLSRAVEQRGGSKRPLLSDLRESGAIEQDADIVLFIYRPEYYNLEEWDDDEGGPTKDQSEIICAKFREGSPFSAIVGNKLEYMRFMDLESGYSELPSGQPLPNGTPESAFGNITSKPKDDKDDDLPF